MTDHKASRTLVKSAPELWAECSDATSLTRHLGAFGEIRITRLEPETAVAWEGDAVSGTVRLEPSGWGTRVILSATAAVPEAVDSHPTDPVETAAVEALEVVDVVEVEPENELQVEDDGRAEEFETEGTEAVEETAEELTPPKVGALGRLLARLGLRRPPAPASTMTGEPDVPFEPAVLEPEATPEPPPTRTTPEPQRRRARPGRPPARPEAAAALDAALDSLGRAHHRPYSRS